MKRQASLLLLTVATLLGPTNLMAGDGCVIRPDVADSQRAQIVKSLGSRSEWGDGKRLCQQCTGDYSITIGFSSRTVDYLIERLASAPPVQAEGILYVLGSACKLQSGLSADQRRVLERLTNESAWAALVLARTSTSIDHLRKLIDWPKDDEVRLRAYYELLNRVNDSDALELLDHAGKDPSPSVRSLAVTRLGMRKSLIENDRWRAFLLDPDAGVRIQLIQGLPRKSEAFRIVMKNGLKNEDTHEWYREFQKSNLERPN